MTAVAGQAVIDGVRMPLADASLSLTDAGVARGDGAFETVGVWDGRPFRLDDHLSRLGWSLEALCLPPAPQQILIEECRQLVADHAQGDGALRIFVTGSGTRIVTLTGQPAPPDLEVLIPQVGPWIQPRTDYRPAGSKSMSYAANMAAGRMARQAGGDDALLFSVPDRYVLEGPTFGVVFVARGIVHAPSTRLGIVDSISRRTLLDIAADHQLEVLTGHWPIEVLADADEVITSSALRPAVAARRVGKWTFGRHPVADLLAQGLEARRRH